MNATENVFTVSVSPHIRSDESVSKIMWNVNLALLPATVFAIWYFGLPAFITIMVSILTAVTTEYLIQKIRKKTITALDGSAVITGLLLAMCLPPQLPWYMTAFGSFMSIAVAKHSMGGLGYNIFNPALIGRAIIMASWPAAMTTWTRMDGTADAVSSATCLPILKYEGYSKLLKIMGGDTALYQSLFLGHRNGCIGETPAILLILGGIFLIYKGYINWQVPFTMIGTVGLFSWVFGTHGLFTGDPLVSMMSGGLIIGAFFMATDMVTIPVTLKGRIIFAVGAGAITLLIRLAGGYPEGVCYAILLMNSVTPLIDRIIKPRKFGARS